jgi:hypothetical protein
MQLWLAGERGSSFAPEPRAAVASDRCHSLPGPGLLSVALTGPKAAAHSIGASPVSSQRDVGHDQPTNGRGAEPQSLRHYVLQSLLTPIRYSGLSREVMAAEGQQSRSTVDDAIVAEVKSDWVPTEPRLWRRAVSSLHPAGTSSQINMTHLWAQLAECGSRRRTDDRVVWEPEICLEGINLRVSHPQQSAGSVRRGRR